MQKREIGVGQNLNENSHLKKIICSLSTQNAFQTTQGLVMNISCDSASLSFCHLNYMGCKLV